MSKRKLVQVAQEEGGCLREEDNHSQMAGSESEEEEGNSELSGSGEEEESDEELREGLSSELEEDDATGESEVSSAEDEEEQENPENAGHATAFGRAFGKIMKKKVSRSTLTEVLGPVLADRKQLLVQKLEQEETERKAKVSRKEEKRKAREKGHILPETYTNAKEKGLIKLATKGVVRLFNAVSKAQKVQAEADLSSSKSAKATWKQSKAAFMMELRAGGKSELMRDPADGTPGTGKHEEKEEEPGWAALKSDFMLGSSKLRDWDKNLEPES